MIDLVRLFSPLSFSLLLSSTSFSESHMRRKTRMERSIKQVLLGGLPGWAVFVEDEKSAKSLLDDLNELAHSITGRDCANSRWVG